MNAVVVCVDTNVFTAALRPRSPLTGLYRKHMFGAKVTIAPQTVAEARYGALRANWGSNRQRELERLIHRADILPVDEPTTTAFARLRYECMLAGHPLHQKQHVGDMWIAAAAVRWRVPLVAHDAIFVGCPRLDLRTELE